MGKISSELLKAASNIGWDNKQHALEKKIISGFISGKLSFHFDLDGTFGDWPVGQHHGIPCDEELERLFNDLNKSSGGRISVITGRPHVFIEGVFPERRFLTFTEFGAVDSSIAKKKPKVRVPFKPEHIQKLQSLLLERMQAEGFDGWSIEHGKIAAITIEMTAAKDLNTTAKKVLDVMRGVVRDFGDIKPSDLMVNDGWTPKVPCVDIVSPIANKGAALRDMMEHPNFFGTTPVYFGDSGSDRPAMEFALSRGGYAVGVGPNAPRFLNGHAERALYFDNTELARDFLRRVSERLERTLSAVPKNTGFCFEEPGNF